jgi:plasmid stabilization system protein ParE
MYQVKILPAAKLDIREAAKWYNEQQPGLGLRFTAYVRNKINSIAANPLVYSVKYANIRAVVLDVFPYMVHFEVDGNIITILAVLHTSRKPLI